MDDDSPGPSGPSPVRVKRKRDKDQSDTSTSAPPTKRPKPVCKYGPTCYQKGRQHREQFEHPWVSSCYTSLYIIDISLLTAGTLSVNYHALLSTQDALSSHTLQCAGIVVEEVSPCCNTILTTLYPIYSWTRVFVCRLSLSQTPFLPPSSLY